MASGQASGCSGLRSCPGTWLGPEQGGVSVPILSEDAPRQYVASETPSKPGCFLVWLPSPQGFQVGSGVSHRLFCIVLLSKARVENIPELSVC